MQVYTPAEYEEVPIKLEEIRGLHQVASRENMSSQWIMQEENNRLYSTSFQKFESSSIMHKSNKKIRGIKLEIKKVFKDVEKKVEAACTTAYTQQPYLVNASEMF